MAIRPFFRNPLSVLALGAITGLALFLAMGGSDHGTIGSTPYQDCQGLPSEDCPAGTPSEAFGTSEIPNPPTGSGPVLSAGQVCVNAGYLCAEGEGDGTLQLFRWPADTERIRVLVPEPGGLPPSEAQTLQRAAMRGIQTWHGHPIPLSVRARSGGESPDFTVEWASSVEDGRLGRAEVTWRRRGEEVRVEVVAFTVATHNPTDPGHLLTAEQVELVAAHEMGHVLGLFHSDDPRDVMFPQNTATRLTVRDFRTIEALYSLPNGAQIHW